VASYLAGVKQNLKALFDEAFESAWREIVEPALKESFRNGVESGRSGKEPPADGSAHPRRFLKHRTAGAKEPAGE
jgi:hypothetical protein